MPLVSSTIVYPQSVCGVGLGATLDILNQLMHVTFLYSLPSVTLGDVHMLIFGYLETGVVHDCIDS